MSQRHDHDNVSLDELPEWDRGLHYDVSTLLRRRGMLGLLGGAGLATLVGCANSADSVGAPAGTATSAGASAAAAGCETTIPQETAGPYPGDGSNGPDVLSQSGIVRGDIRSSFGASSETAAGVPLTINLTVLNTSNSCAFYGGAAVYLWHCDREGRYSMYSAGVEDQNYLRGVQAADDRGRVTFTSIFPAAYLGRWPHIHFEVYPNVGAATSADNKITTSQLALPQDACDAVYATDGYSTSVRNMAQTSLARDMVFSDGYAAQMATLTGDPTAGYTATLSVAV
jgi:protocatechuate 3,4-dioxygenase beta subunit